MSSVFARLPTALRAFINTLLARPPHTVSDGERRYRLLYQISQELTATLDPREVAERALFQICAALGAFKGAIFIFQPATARLYPIAITGISAEMQSDLLKGLDVNREEGLVGWVAARRQPAVLNDVSKDKRWRPVPGVDDWVRSAISIPLIANNVLVGVLSLHSESVAGFQTEQVPFIIAAAAPVAIALQNASLFDIERRRAEQAEALHRATQALISSPKPAELLRLVVGTLARSPRYRFVSAFAHENGLLKVQAAQGYQTIPDEPVPISRGVIGRVARTGEAVYLPDVRADADYIAIEPSIQSLIALPIHRGNDVLGVLLIESDSSRELDLADYQWLTTFSSNLSFILENARLTADLESARDRLVQHEKLAVMGQLIASVTHELNNPLQAIQNALFLVQQELDPSVQSYEDVRVAIAEADRMAELIGRLRNSYRPASIEDRQPESLNALVDDVHKLISAHLRHNNVSLQFHPQPDLPTISATRSQITQVILNLSLNAVEAMPAGGTITIRTEYQPASHGIMLTVADTGIGIDPADLPHVFEPFYTTKRSGTGLGLAITHDIIRQHNGEITAESMPGKGTQVRIWFPAS